MWEGVEFHALPEIGHLHSITGDQSRAQILRLNAKTAQLAHESSTVNDLPTQPGEARYYDHGPDD